jgi:hypothetical protein
MYIVIDGLVSVGGRVVQGFTTTRKARKTATALTDTKCYFGENMLVRSAGVANCTVLLIRHADLL